MSGAERCVNPQCEDHGYIHPGPCTLLPRKCLDHVLVYLDGKPEFEWACELDRGHKGQHVEGRYGWSA